MVRRLPLPAVLTLVLWSLPGCATVVSQICAERGPRVFSGSRRHLDAMANPDELGRGERTVGVGLVNDYWLPTGAGGLGAVFVYWAPLDFLLSLAADAVILPYTIPAQLVWGNFEADNPKIQFLAAGATGDIALARGLLEQHPDFAKEHHSDGWSEDSFLSIAAATGRPEFVTLLIDCGADVNGASGRPALINAVRPLLPSFLSLSERKAVREQARYIDVVRILIENGADVNASKLGGWEPLHWAAYTGDEKMAQFLIEHGAHVSTEESTPLHTAAWQGHLKVARLLIEHGADVNARNMNGETPLARALRHRKSAVAELLRAHGGKQ